MAETTPSHQNTKDLLAELKSKDEEIVALRNLVNRLTSEATDPSKAAQIAAGQQVSATPVPASVRPWADSHVRYKAVDHLLGTIGAFLCVHVHTSPFPCHAMRACMHACKQEFAATQQHE